MDNLTKECEESKTNMLEDVNDIKVCEEKKGDVKNKRDRKRRRKWYIRK